MFTPGAPVWSPGHLADLHERFVVEYQAGPDPFLMKLERQLGGADPLTIQLASEMLFFYSLGIWNLSEGHRRELVETPLLWMPDPPAFPEEFESAMGRGVAHIAQAHTWRKNHLEFLIEFVRRWKQELDPSEQAAMLDDPWSFRERVFEIKIKGAATEQHLLLHLVFPDTFEPIASDRHKDLLIAAFGDRAEGEYANKDRRLAAIRADLDKDYGVGFSFYDEAVRSLWDVAEPKQMGMDDLISFVRDDMHLSGVHQPAAILALLENDGEATADEVAATIAGWSDRSQDEIRADIWRYPGEVLASHEVVTLDSGNERFVLRASTDDADGVAVARELCTAKLVEFRLRELLGKFSDPVPFTSDHLADAPSQPGVHVVWDHEGGVVYVGHTNRSNRERLHQHLTGDREASSLHNRIGRQLDEEYGRTATRDEIRSWLGRGTVSWVSTDQPEELKEELLRILEARGDATTSVWDEFVSWIRRIGEGPSWEADSPNYLAAERHFKLLISQRLNAARDAVLANDQDWPRVLRKAFGAPNNLTYPITHTKFLGWVDANTERAREALLTLWQSSAEPATRVNDFLALVPPEEFLKDRGGRVQITSFLMMADASEYPVYRPKPFKAAVKAVSYERFPNVSEGEIYRHALGFLDRVIDEAAARSFVLEDRLDAQGAVFAVMAGTNEFLSDDENSRISAFRAEGANTWWVNQGATYQKERAGGYIWAPQQTKAGTAASHHLNVSKVRKGDVIVHYANGHVNAIGRASSNGRPADRPSELPGTAWSKEGYRAEVEYFDLDEPIALAEIPYEWRQEEAPAFNRNGGVNQGYLYPLSITFNERLDRKFRHRWPAGSPLEYEEVNHWLLKVDRLLPDNSDLLEALENGNVVDWPVGERGDEMQPGDDVLLWQRGADGGWFASALIAGDLLSGDDEGQGSERPANTMPAIPLVLAEWREDPVGGRGLRDHPLLRDLGVFTDPQSTVVRLTDDQFDALQSLLLGEELEPTEGTSAVDISNVTLADVAVDFSAKLDAAGLRFGPRHDELARAFVVSLATKRFLLLTGLSGSGKTRLGMAFGQWLGRDQHRVEAVRPDWTGPDALLGYENGLSEVVDGHPAWSVPAPLEFMLRAVANPTTPYLLLLDEMNLAHVERYFADALSGMESGEPVLPNLAQSVDGSWRIVDPEVQRLPFPDNLFIVGTVNIDETTYMFSPKVLDRANTLEFRVLTDDLKAHGTRPDELESGSRELVARFFEEATNDPVGWGGRDDMARWLKDLHAILGGYDREFGHRVFYEALRFGELLSIAGESDPMQALDLQVMQKVLPRFHGSIRQLSEPMAVLGSWCFHGPEAEVEHSASFDPLQPPDGDPALPVSFDKILRMTRRLRDNHFVSFAE